MQAAIQTMQAARPQTQAAATRCRKATIVRSTAAPATATKLNTKRSEEVGPPAPLGAPGCCRARAGLVWGARSLKAQAKQ